MIKLLELSFEGIGRFTKKQTIDFRNRDKLIQVDGKNENTGGSSGAGKSTIFNSIDYLLGLNDTPATSLQSRITKAGISVEGVFEIDGKPVTIARSKKDGLSIIEESESITGNVKLAEERLDHIIGINKKLFKKMIHKKQKEGGFFLNLTAKESYEFLIKVLDLESWTNKLDKIDLDIKENAKKLDAVKLTYDLTKSSMADCERILASSVKPDECKYSEIDVQTQKDIIRKLESILISTENEMEREVENIPEPKPKAVITTEDPSLKELRELSNQIKVDSAVLKNSHSIKLNNIRNELSSTKDRITKAEAAETEFKSIVNKIQKLKENKVHIESATCPTCVQSWTGKGANDKLNDINAELDNLASKAWESKNLMESKNEYISKYNDINSLLMVESTINPSEELDKKLEITNKSIAEKEAKIHSSVSLIETENKLAKSDYLNTVQKIKTQYIEKINNFKSKLAELNNQLNNTIYYISSHNKAVKDYEDNYNRTLEIIKDKVDYLSYTEEEKIKISKQISIAEESKKAIKAYTLQIFQESLDYIGEQASVILSDIPNMANASIHFESSKETKSGSIKDEVNAIVNMDGESEVNIKTLSGGERTAIDLAVDLALIDMIESKAGKGADFFILDEPFDGLDSRNKEECLYLLQQLDTSKKIIIVDHSPELKAMVHDVITINRIGEESFVV